MYCMGYWKEVICTEWNQYYFDNGMNRLGIIAHDCFKRET